MAEDQDGTSPEREGVSARFDAEAAGRDLRRTVEVRVSGSEGVQFGDGCFQINVDVVNPGAGPAGRMPEDIGSFIAGVLRVLEEPAVQAKLAEAVQRDYVPPASGIPGFGVVGTHPPTAPGPALSSPMSFLRDAARLVSTSTGSPLGKAGVMAVAEVMAAQCGEYDLAQQWLLETPSLPEISDPVQRAAAQALHAWAFGECGHLVAARSLVNRVRDSISRLAPGQGDDPKAQAQVRVLVEWVACRQGDKEGSTGLIGAMAEVAEQQSDPLTRSVFFGGLAWTWFLAGSADRSETARLLGGAVTAALACEGTTRRIMSLLFAAWVAGQLAELETARTLLVEVEESARRIWHPDLHCIVLSVAAVAAAQAGDPALAGHLRKAATSVGFSKDWKVRSLALAAWLRDAPSRMRTSKYIAATRRQKSLTVLARARKLAKNDLDLELDLNPDLVNMISFSVELGIDGVQVLAMLARAWALAAGGYAAAADRVIAEAARLIRSMNFGGSRILMLGIASCVARGTGDAYRIQAQELVTELLKESDKLVAKGDDSIAADDPGPESDGHGAEDERGLPPWAYLLPTAWLRAQRGGPAMATVVTAMVKVAGAPAEGKDYDDEVLAWCTGVAWAAIWTGGREQALELLVKVTEEAARRPEDELVRNFALHAAVAWAAAQGGERERALRLVTRLAALAVTEDGTADPAGDDGLPQRELSLIAAAWIVSAGGRPPYQEVVRVLGTLLPSGQGSGSLVTLRDSWIALFKRIALASPA